VSINSAITLSAFGYDSYNMIIDRAVILLDDIMVKDCGPSGEYLFCDYSLTARQAGVGKHVLRLQVADMAGNTTNKDIHFTVTRTVPIVEPPHLQ
jgi:hypothetical protein